MGQTKNAVDCITDISGELKTSERLMVRDAIKELGKTLVDMPDVMVGDNEYYPVEHLFTDGMYIRRMSIPKGTVIVGKIHRHKHPMFLESGVIVVVNEFFGKTVRIGPYFGISPAGVCNAVYTRTDSVWTTVHANPDDIIDLEELEKMIITDKYNELL